MTSFNTIEVERINVRESDGTLRMVIANKAKQDTGNVDGVNIHEPGSRHAGMIFFNDLGDEMGGLIFGGTSKENTGGSLTFDRWKNDQTIQMLYSDTKKGFTSGIVVADRPNDHTLVELLKRQQKMKLLPKKEQKLAYEELVKDVREKKINLGETRVFSGVKNGVAQLSLHDSNGKLKVKISVADQGPGKIEFFDDNGNLISDKSHTLFSANQN